MDDEELREALQTIKEKAGILSTILGVYCVPAKVLNELDYRVPKDAVRDVEYFDIYSDHPYKTRDIYICPTCGGYVGEVGEEWDVFYCPNCGQAVNCPDPEDDDEDDDE